jgi:hypothetical protein
MNRSLGKKTFRLRRNQKKIPDFKIDPLHLLQRVQFRDPFGEKDNDMSLVAAFDSKESIIEEIDQNSTAVLCTL